jgi:uncharacterized membrane protein (UPF0182 family)
MRKVDWITFLYGLLAGVICLILPTLASIQFEYLDEKGFFIFVLPLIGFLCSFGLLYIVMELALSFEDFFVIIWMGGFMPAGLLPFLGIIAFQEHSISMFSKFMLALITVSLFMLLVGVFLESYDEYGLNTKRTIFGLVITTIAFCVIKWTSLSKTIGAANILNNRLNSSLDVLSTIFK